MNATKIDKGIGAFFIHFKHYFEFSLTISNDFNRHIFILRKGAVIVNFDKIKMNNSRTYHFKDKSEIKT